METKKKASLNASRQKNKSSLSMPTCRTFNVSKGGGRGLALAVEDLEDAYDMDFSGAAATKAQGRSWLEDIQLVLKEVSFLFHLEFDDAGLPAHGQELADGAGAVCARGAVAVG